MQLDQARIVIRERNFGEILGLALQCCREHIGGLTLAGFIGTAPFAVLNWLLLHGLLSHIEYEDNRPGYWLAMLFLMAIETPLATAPITLYMGQMTFAERISPRVLWTTYWRRLPQMLWLQGIVRALLMPILLLPYFWSPYLSELILLELNSLFGGRGQLTTRKRSKNLHGNNGGELFSRWLLSLAAGGLLWAMLATGAWMGLRMLFSVSIDEIQVQLYLLPITLWIVIGFIAVVRFLSYLDLRIRREGWEIELLLRAEAQRMRQSMAFG